MMYIHYEAVFFLNDTEKKKMDYMVKISDWSISIYTC